jgi:hypothetical protein
MAQQTINNGDDGVDVRSDINSNFTELYTDKLTSTQLTDLTDAGDSALHYHATDRDRANHTGTQLASTISDFDTSVSNNTDVSNNTTFVTTVFNVKNHASYNVNDISIAVNDLIQNASDGDRIYLDGGQYQSKKIVMNTGKKITLELLGEIELITDNILFECTNKFGQNQKIICEVLKTSVSNATAFALRGYSNGNIEVSSIRDFRHGIANIPNRSFFDVSGSITNGSPTLTVNNADDMVIGTRISIFGVSGVFEISNIVGTVITLDKNADATVTDARVVNVYHLGTGSITSGTNSLVVNDGTRFAQDDVIFIHGVQGKFIITNVSVNTLTLDGNADVTVTDAFIGDTLGTVVNGTKTITVNNPLDFEVGMIVESSTATSIGQKTITDISGSVLTVIDTIFTNGTDIDIRILDSSTGNQYNKVTAQLMDTTKANVFNGVGEYTCWVNENTYYDWKAEGKHGIYFERYANERTRWVYDNNKHYNVGFEDLTGDAIKLSNTNGTSFIGCRLEETVGGYYINEDETCVKSTYLLNGEVLEDQVKLWGIKSKLVGGYLTAGGSNYHREINNNAEEHYIVEYSDNGILAVVTGSINSGSDEFTVTDASSFSVYDFIKITGVTGIFRITEINSLVLTLDGNADATVTGATMTTYTASTSRIGTFGVNATVFDGSNSVSVNDGSGFSVNDYVYIEGVTGLKQIDAKTGTFPSVLTLDSPCTIEYTNRSKKELYNNRYLSVNNTDDEIDEKYSYVIVTSNSSAVNLTIPVSRNVDGEKIRIVVQTFTNTINIKNYLGNTVASSAIDEAGTYELTFIFGRWTLLKLDTGVIY